MPYPTNMVYVRWEFGWQPGAQEADIQDFGIWGHISDPSAPPFPGWNNVCDGLSQRAANAWATNFQAGRFAAPVKFRRAVCYHYDQPLEQVLDRGESTGTQGVPWAGTGAACPPQLSVAVTTQGFDPAVAAAQSRRKRGRFYLPTPGKEAFDNDGELVSTWQNEVMTMAANFWDDLTGTFDNVHMEPMVVSRAGQFVTPITWLRMGRVIDTQRRRRNRIAESYVNHEL